jgi:hypothetical protein
VWKALIRRWHWDGIRTLHEGTLHEGTLDEGTLDEGTLDEGTLHGGTLDEGTLDEGTLDKGTLFSSSTHIVLFLTKPKRAWARARSKSTLDQLRLSGRNQLKAIPLEKETTVQKLGDMG